MHFVSDTDIFTDKMNSKTLGGIDMQHPLTLNSKLAPLRTSHNTLLSAENDYYAHERSHTSIMLHMRCHGGIILLHIKDAMYMLAICCT